MEEPKVTVIIPTRNRAHFVGGALDSVLGQTRPDLAVLVSDNASQDGTAELLAAVEDPRVTVVRHDVDVGMTENFNSALRQVTTPYVALLLDDDLWHPRLLEAVLPRFDDAPRAGVAHTAFSVLDTVGRVVQERADWHAVPVPTGVTSGAVLRADLLGGRHPVMVSASVWRTEALPAQLWDARDVQAEDVGILLRLSLDWDVLWVDEVLASFRLHPDSVSVAAGHVVGDGTVPGFAQVAQWRAAKDRFLDEQAERLPDVSRLRRVVAAKARQDALATVWALTVPERDPGRTVELLRQAAVHVPGLAGDPRTWRLLLRSLAGPRGVRRLRSPRPATTPGRRPTGR